MNRKGNLGMNVNGKLLKKYICERILEVGREAWQGGFNYTERDQHHIETLKTLRCHPNI